MKVPQWLKVVGWLLLIFLVYAIFRSPTNAADLVVSAVNGIGSGLGAIFTFFDTIISRLSGQSVLSAGTSALAVAWPASASWVH